MTAQANLSIEQRIQQAIAAHQRGDLASAETLYLQILAIRSHHFDTRHSPASIRFHQGRT